MRKLATLFWILSNELKFEREFACILTNFKMEHRVAYSQLECLVGFLEEHPQLARGATGLGGRSKETIDRKWRELADILNAIENGSIKDGDRWKKYWKDLRLRVKAKASHLRQEATATGGGTPNSDQLSSMDRRILAFVGEEVVEGDRTHYVSFLPPASATTLPASTSQEMSPAVVRQLPAEDMQATPQMPTNSPQGASATPTGRSSPVRQPSRRRLNFSPTRLTFARHHELTDEWVMQLEERRMQVEEKLATAAMITAEATHAMEQNTKTLIDIILLERQKK
ncbi:unnamed protein product [Callosobruchus maculatus]|uniref:Regulatory protein zeste n=1 Tax=Callosobruchus maculatus TaxID=64391 RepID=A0A653DFR6_CALMS|nr:unnamed protein product [Callosobruchus maculatus]